MKTFSQQKMVRKMKFISDQGGIMNRYLRESRHWDTHLTNTKEFIANSFPDKKLRSVAVLGSGWLLDVPLSHLAEKYEKVLLVDVHHPTQVIKKAKKYSHVECYETDITGGGIQFCWNLRKKQKEYLGTYLLEDFRAETPKLPWEPEALISVNILNQLDIFLVDFLKAIKGRCSNADFDQFRKNIQTFHLHWLSTKAACLISDVEEENVNENGDMTKEKLVFAHFPEAKRSQEWYWEFDQSGTYHSGKKTRMKVNAMEW